VVSQIVSEQGHRVVVVVQSAGSWREMEWPRPHAGRKKCVARDTDQLHRPSLHTQTMPHNRTRMSVTLTPQVNAASYYVALNSPCLASACG
jgi:hypothetical protein